MKRVVIVVDDDDAIRIVARELLEADGFDVRMFSRASEGLFAIRRESAAAAIVDFDVAHREGLDLAEAICRDEELEDTALIGVAFDLRRVDLELVDLAIAKPYAVLDLGQLVRRAIARAMEGEGGAPCASSAA